MSVNPDLFRNVMSHYATGVTVVTARVGDKKHGLTVNAICSVSLDPPLLLVCVRKHTYSYKLITESQNFAVNILSLDQEMIAKRFANNTLTADERFLGVDYRSEVSGAPILEEALSWLDCKVVAAYPGGDHTIFLGEVMALERRTDMQPLLFFRSEYQKQCTCNSEEMVNFRLRNGE